MMGFGTQHSDSRSNRTEQIAIVTLSHTGVDII